MIRSQPATAHDRSAMIINLDAYRRGLAEGTVLVGDDRGWDVLARQLAGASTAPRRGVRVAQAAQVAANLDGLVAELEAAVSRCLSRLEPQFHPDHSRATSQG